VLSDEIRSGDRLAHSVDSAGAWRQVAPVVTINGRKHWLWRAVDQHGVVKLAAAA
jgi:transposase-like protein